MGPAKGREAKQTAARAELLVESLLRGDAAAAGRIVTQSHRSLRDDFEVSHPALDALLERVGEIPGVLGARMTGAGFGGCTVNLVERDALEELLARVNTQYPKRCGLQPEVLVVQHSLEAGRLTD